MKYSIDTCSLTRAWWDRYPPESFPGFWENVDALIKSGELRAIEEVREELKKQDDELLAWLNQRESIFVEIDSGIQVALKEVMSEHKRLVDDRKNRSGADPWVIALAKANGCAVVTEELGTSSLKRPHIPDVCDALDVRCINILGVIREERWVFG